MSESNDTPKKLIGNDKNFKIVKGKKIVCNETKAEFYNYKFLDFNNIQKIQTDEIKVKYDSNEYTLVGKNSEEQQTIQKLVRNLMLGKTSLIRIHSIQEQEELRDGNYFEDLLDDINIDKNEGNEKNKINDFLKDDEIKYNKSPSGIETPYGSIISMPLILNKNIPVSKNGLKINGQRSKGYNWDILREEFGNNINDYDSLSEEERKKLDGLEISSRRFGYTNDKNYIVNSNSRIGKIKEENFPDDPIIQKRTYSLNTYALTGKGKELDDDDEKDDETINSFIKDQLIEAIGSFAFCYNIQSYNNKEEGVTPEQKAIEPLVELQVGIYEINFNNTNKFAINNDKQEEEGEEGSGGEEEKIGNTLNLSNRSQKNLIIQIMPDGQIISYAKGIKATGGMSTPSSDFLPPQCLLSNNTLKPLFIYPVYSGIIITNCINKSIKQGAESIIIKLQDNVNFIQNLIVDTEKKISKDIADLIEQQGVDGDGQLKWLPAIYKQAEQKVKLRLKNTKRVIFGKTVKVTWVKSLGSFAYCPLFFYNRIGFDLFFKSGLVKTGSSDSKLSMSSKFNVFPIISDINLDNYVDDKKDKKDKIDEMNVRIEKSYYDDTDLQESIYFLPFSIYNKYTKRYPIQVFGVVIISKGTIELDSNSNGTFSFGKNNDTITLQTELEEQQGLTNYIDKNTPPWIKLIKNCQISCGLQGVTGKLILDSYMLEDSMSQNFIKYNIGEIDLDIQRDNESPTLLFKGFGYQLSKSNTESDNNFQINLVGMQQKLEDIKLVNTPFWDGDKLQSICSYFEKYANVKLKMVNYKTEQTLASSSSEDEVILNAIPVQENAITQNKTEWISSPQRVVDTGIISKEFRVPRSINWESPAIDYKTGTSCLTALMDLGTQTSSVFVVGLDGIGYFYEINKFGIPYYALKVTSKSNGKCECINYGSNDKTNFVSFELGELINFSMQQPIVNKYNTIVTFGFLQKKTNNMKKGKDQSNLQSIPGSFYTKLTKNEQGGITIPWTKIHVGVQNGFFTKSQLLSVHLNKLSSTIANVSLASITVLGNTKVNHVYQVIFIGKISFFVVSIQHNIDITNKNWTTTYQIQRAEIDDLNEID